jgi:acyl carrier protein
MGGDPLMSDTALGYLEKMLLSGEHLSAVMELDWSVLSRNLPNATANKYREIALTSGQHEQAESSADDIAELIKTMSSDELFEFIAASLKHELSSILLIAEDKIDINRSLFDIGLDSLMGVELMTVIETRFDIQLSVMALSESPTLAKLTQRIVDKLHGSSENDDTDQSIVNDLAGRHGVKSEIETN